jgi:Flp pilus assembly protein TadB
MRAKHPGWRIVMLGTGWFLVVLAPIVGALPGPGGIFVFAAGLVLLLRNSCWARRNYVLFKRRFPRIGHACDRVMRRGSTLRRQQRLDRCAPQPD